ncbi:hypothetical protein LJC22_07380 [Desulfosarcina sp. OttesenSCG-928-G10]|nr:hypothetical protein [Desulfosarcina sp. OttesenSCG-928-G10]MDL2322260.1 hypothetical protein [Desulfosarcina sp. OttesenSCG-928-B08]
MIKQTENIMVFISYLDEGNIVEEVMALAEWLCGQDVEAITYHAKANPAPEIGRRSWVQQKIEDAEIVLVVCTELYKNVFEKREAPNGEDRDIAWMSAIITSEMYDTGMRNNKFFPVLPLGGKGQHIPAVLKEWHTGLSLENKKEILSLIRKKRGTPIPCNTLKPSTKKRHGEVPGSEAPILNPKEGVLFGRQNEIKQIKVFIESGKNVLVTGGPGIGKTEVCKAVLREYLKTNTGKAVFYIKIPDKIDPDSFGLYPQLGDYLGYPGKLLQDFSAMGDDIPKGLYYLDNMESLMQSELGVDLVRRFSEFPGVSILASSRWEPGYSFTCEGLEIPALHLEDAKQLFQKLWKGDNPDCKSLELFLNEKLGNHPLSISLLARMGKTYSWEELCDEWENRIDVAKTNVCGGDRQDSLLVSFSITRNFIEKKDGALELWLFSALFQEGIDSKCLKNWREISSHRGALRDLVAHYILQREGTKFTISPPTARYALHEALLKTPAETPFSWERMRKIAYEYFQKILSDGVALSSQAILEQHVASMRFLDYEQKSGKPDEEQFEKLKQRLDECKIGKPLTGSMFDPSLGRAYKNSVQLNSPDKRNFFSNLFQNSKMK